jgi:transcriptional regulator with XRE-family HTH domain
MTALAERVPVAVAFGARARELRLERDWTLEATAARAGVGRATLHRVERGDNVRLGTAANVAAAFGMTLAEMLATALAMAVPGE